MLPAAIVNACRVAVLFNGVPLEIFNQSRSPVATVSDDEMAPTRSASHHPCANPCRATPALLKIAAMVAKVYAPIVASVSGGWLGWPGKPRRTFMRGSYPRPEKYNKPTAAPRPSERGPGGERGRHGSGIEQ